MKKLITIGALHFILVACSSSHTGLTAISLIQTNRGYIEECNGNGVDILTGVDYNSNKVIDVDEVTDSSYICDGTNGVDGEDGQDVTTIEPTTNVTIVLNPRTCIAWSHDKIFKGDKKNNKCNFTM